jgi:5'-nucleotidase
MILLVNDDGIDAPGLRALYRALRRRLGLPVLVVAPASERSGQSQAITLDRPIGCHFRHSDGFCGFAIDGTPTDCTKLALDQLCARRPVLVVSGINAGPNVGRSILYSGTLGAALEAAVLGCTALAVSRQHGNATHEDGAEFAAQWAERILPRTAALQGRVVNLNLPGGPAARWRPIMNARHGLAGFQESYRRTGPRDGQRAGWKIDGTWTIPPGDTSDAALLDQGHPVLSLLQPDLNAPERVLEELIPA